ncbi:alpha/beta fold hydrolase [Aestuariibacter salexigens]|uniref:alpha/beta fold hydrolase n=1 Tax=Aestuariibacter salexigens TaxID=226010 RepID=UPI0004043E9E|nr:alpha/beta fold hydrolase [Aestuariibacter salexigens]
MSILNYLVSDQQPGIEDAPWVTLIHGLFGSLDNLTMLRRHLQEKFRVLSIDLPDHGKSAHTEQFSFEEYAERIIATLEHVGINRCHLVGHSLGGKISMQIAMQHPDVLDKLVVADIAPVNYTPRHDNVFKGLRNVDLDALQSRQHANEMLSVYVREPGTRQFLLKSLYQEEGKWQWRFNLSTLEKDYSKLIGAIDDNPPFSGDVLFIKGQHSDYITAEHREEIAKRFPRSKAKIIQGTGHWLHAEKPQVFNRIVDDFLSN